LPHGIGATLSSIVPSQSLSILSHSSAAGVHATPLPLPALPPAGPLPAAELPLPAAPELAPDDAPLTPLPGSDDIAPAAAPIALGPPGNAPVPAPEAAVIDMPAAPTPLAADPDTAAVPSPITPWGGTVDAPAAFSSPASDLGTQRALISIEPVGQDASSQPSAKVQASAKPSVTAARRFRPIVSVRVICVPPSKLGRSYADFSAGATASCERNAMSCRSRYL